MIVINKKPNIDENNITFCKKEYKRIVIDNESIYLINNHNTLEFLPSDYDDNPILVVNKYYKDYPLIGDQSIYQTFYSIKNTIDSNQNDIVKIPLNKIIDYLEENMYDNPRNNEITKEMIKIIKKLKKEKILCL